ncbi:MAG TPA: hypothetical protein VM846_14430 [Vicinamibacterales bacterium]|jgi:hypothetical protein|nr:hypothetical protein [Vicinamibacterales bacterium]
MRRLIPAFIFILTCAAAPGCGDDTPVAAPIEPPVEITETITGTVTILGANMHIFTTERAGEAQVQVDSLSPNSAAVVSLILGTWNGNNCQAVLIKDDATTGSSLLGTASAVGSFCVRVADIGRLTEPTSYTITITHF